MAQPPPTPQQFITDEEKTGLLFNRFNSTLDSILQSHLSLCSISNLANGEKLYKDMTKSCVSVIGDSLIFVLAIVDCFKYISDFSMSGASDSIFFPKFNKYAIPI